MPGNGPAWFGGGPRGKGVSPTETTSPRGLSCPRRALDSPPHDQSDRVDLRHRQTPDQDHPRAGVTRRGAGDGVQAHRGRPGPLARGQRPAPGRARPGRRHVRGRQARRTTRRTPPTRSRLNDLHPQVLTIARVAMLSGSRRAPPSSIDSMVNVGTIPGRPPHRAASPAGGQVRCRPMAAGWGGGPVVVRARERRAHGEGGQQVGREDAGMPGGCRR